MELQLNEVKVKIFDSIKSEGFTIDKWNEFQSYLVQDIGIGSTMQDVNSHHAKLDHFLANNNLKEAAKERENMQYNFFAMLNKINFKSLCFGILIDSVNDEKVTDYSEGAIKKRIDYLASKGLTNDHVSGILEEVKKKLESELSLYIPEIFIPSDGNYFDYLKKKYYQKCEYLITGNKSCLQMIKDAEAYMLDIIRPKNFDPSDKYNEVIEHENTFEKMCAILEDCGCHNPKRLTVYEFYKRVAYYKDKHKPKK